MSSRYPTQMDSVEYLPPPSPPTRLEIGDVPRGCLAESRMNARHPDAISITLIKTFKVLFLTLDVTAEVFLKRKREGGKILCGFFLPLHD